MQNCINIINEYKHEYTVEPESLGKPQLKCHFSEKLLLVGKFIFVQIHDLYAIMECHRSYDISYSGKVFPTHMLLQQTWGLFIKNMFKIPMCVSQPIPTNSNSDSSRSRLMWKFDIFGQNLINEGLIHHFCCCWDMNYGFNELNKLFIIETLSLIRVVPLLRGFTVVPKRTCMHTPYNECRLYKLPRTQPKAIRTNKSNEYSQFTIEIY